MVRILQHLLHIDKEKAEKIERMAFNILLVAALILFFVTLIGKYKPLFIMSDSMYPSLKKGQVVAARKVDDDEVIKVGNVYTYQNPDYYYTVTHRCIEKIEENNETVYIFKGDNNKDADEVSVKRDWIKYRVLKK